MLRSIINYNNNLSRTALTESTADSALFILSGPFIHHIQFIHRTQNVGQVTLAQLLKRAQEKSEKRLIKIASHAKIRLPIHFCILYVNIQYEIY